MNRLVLSLALLMISGASIASEDTNDLISSVAQEAVNNYAEIYNVSADDAKKALLLEANQEVVLQDIENEFKGRLAGISIEHSPYKMVVRVKGNGKNSKRIFNFNKNPNSSLSLDLPIEIIYGAKVSKNEAKGQVKKASNLVKNYFPSLVTTSYVEATGSIVAKVNGKEDPILVEKVQREWKNPNLPLRIEFSNIKVSPLSSTYGGTPIVKTYSGSTYREDCTLGFGVKDATNSKYMLTASHCPNDMKSKLDGTTYTTIKDFPFSTGTDIKIVSSPHEVVNQFYDSPSSTRSLIGRRTIGSTAEGNRVCHYGASTGYSCGTVAELNAEITGYPGTWIYVKTDTSKGCAGGDSGGPVFTPTNVANGILSLGAVDTSDPKYCYGYYYIPTDVIYSKGYSFVY